MGATTLFICFMAAVSAVLSGYAWSRDIALSWRFAVEENDAPQAPPQFEKVLDYAAPTGQAHSPAILLDGDEARIVWFEGSAEAQADVDIYAVALRRLGGTWQASVPAPHVTRAGLGAAMDPRQLVVTLGNTVQNETKDNALFATVVSVGGWAMASVADVQMGQNGPSHARKLNLSPFLNRSHLVKSPMVAYADGSHALPAYFEMGATHGALVRLGPDGRVRDTRRLWGRGVKPIQPMIVVLSEFRAVAFLRDFDPSGVLWRSETTDGGQNWSEVVATGITNPSAPVAALPLHGGRILMAMNDTASAGRLSLALSDDEGRTWRIIHTLEDDGGAARYPMLRRLPSEEIMLTYSHGTKRGIRAYVFNEVWVGAQ